MEEALLADKIIVMKQGKIELQGTPGEVFGRVERIKELARSADMAEVAAELRSSGHQIPEKTITPGGVGRSAMSIRLDTFHASV